MSVSNFIPNDGSLWSIRAVDISGNYNQKLNFDASGNAIIQTGNTDRLTINSSGAWTCQGGMTYNNSTNTLTAGTFSGTATTATNIAGGLGGSIPYQTAVNTTALLANGTAGQVLTSAGTTLAPTWTTPSAGGNSANVASQVYSEDFIQFVGPAGAYYGPLSLVANGAGAGGAPFFPGRYGVEEIDMGTPATAFANVYGPYPSISGGPDGTSLNCISSDTTGLGLTIILQPFAFAQPPVAGQNVFQVGFMKTPSNITTVQACAAIRWNGSVSANWQAVIGNSTPVSFTTAATGNLSSKWCVFRLVPDSTGVTFYLYNQTDSIDYGSARVLYSASSGSGLTAYNTTGMYYGAAGYRPATGSGGGSFAIDYIGIQVLTTRIYP